MHLGFRGKIFVALFGVAAAALLLVGTLASFWLRGQTYARIEQSLVSEGRLIADILEHHPADVSPATMQGEAQRIGRTLPARVTFIAADGTVVGDSMVLPGDLPSLENHATRPEVVAARQAGTGIARRYSHTLSTDMLYIAVRCRHPLVGTVRLALPLTEVDQQVAAVRRGTLLALLLALLGAVAAAVVTSLLLGRRLNVIAAAARRYAAGDLSTPVRDYGSDELGTVARALDGIVRELARRVGELAADRARIDAILSGMVEGVVVVNGQGRVQLVNAAARAMLGVTDAATDAHYVESVRQPGVAALLSAALRGEQPGGLEIKAPRAAERRLIARAAPVAAAGGNGAVLVLHDITDLRRADQVRRDFVANVSHELRTPLTAIRGYIEALADEPLSAEDRARFLEVIARHASRMERLVRDLLRLASLDARQETIERAECPVEELLRGCAADLSPVVDSRRQHVEVRVEPGAARINTDPAKLHDVLRNLVENAVSYSPEGSAIRLEATTRDRQLVLTISDEGPGIPEADLERIFERFYRVDKARSRESGGTGLGLSIVKHLVDLLGGRVWAANRPDGGAVFTVSLPLDPPATAAPAGTPANREVRPTPS